MLNFSWLRVFIKPLPIIVGLDYGICKGASILNEFVQSHKKNPVDNLIPNPMNVGYVKIIQKCVGGDCAAFICHFRWACGPDICLSLAKRVDERPVVLTEIYCNNVLKSLAWILRVYRTDSIIFARWALYRALKTEVTDGQLDPANAAYVNYVAQLIMQCQVRV